MHAWRTLHILFQFLNILWCVNCVPSINEPSQWNDSLTSPSAGSSTSLPNVSSTSRRNETTWNSEELFITEKKKKIATLPLNSLADDASAVPSTLTERNKSSDEISRRKTNATNEEKHHLHDDEEKFQDFMELDADNTIERSHSDSIDSGNHLDRAWPKFLESITECQFPERPSTSIRLWNDEEYTKKKARSSEVTSEGVKAEVIQVQDLRIKDPKPDSLTVTWKRPNNTVEVIQYIVEWSYDTSVVNSCKVSNDTELHEIVLTSLKSCNTYTVKVKPHMAEHEGAERVVTESTGLDVHSDPLDLKIANTTTDSLRISWNMPGTGCVAHYLVEVCDERNCSQTKINTTNFSKTDLSPCLTYFFNVTVYGVEGPYGTVNVTGKTDFLKPDKITSASTKRGDHSLEVFWDEPNGHTCAEYYRVTWSRNGKNETNRTTENHLDLKNLEACAIYEIVITAGWDDGESEPCLVTSNITFPEVIDPPLALHEPSATKDEILMLWQLSLNKTNNCATRVLTAECSATNVLGTGYTPKNGTTELLINSGMTNVMMKTAVKNLTAFTNYTCYSFIRNLGSAERQSSSRMVVITLEDVPSAPKLLPALQSNVTNSTIALMWKKPLYVPGTLTKFEIQVIWQYKFDRPTWCDGPDMGSENISISNINVTSVVYNAMPKTRYRIKMLAATSAGWGVASTIEEFFTNPGKPSEVTRLRYVNQSTIDPNILDVTIMWGLPCWANSEKIQYFRVIGNGKRDGFEAHDFEYRVNYTKNSCINETCAVMIDNLREEHTYEIEVATKVQDYEDLGDFSGFGFLFPAGIPPPPDENYTSLISIDPLKARRTTTTATVLLPIFPDVRGVIRCYAIIVSKRGYNVGTFGRCNDLSSCPHTATWEESKLEDFTISYQAVKFCSDSHASFVADYGRLRAVKFVLGEDTETCPKLSSDSEERFYCNGPLNPDTWYDVRMRAFTNGGYRDSIIFTVKTNAELQVRLIIGAIFGILFLGILTTMMLLVRKCSLQAVLRRFLHSDMPGSPVPAPFTRRKFIAHCQQLADNPGKLSNEYQLLQTLSVDLQMPTNAACLQANRKKNRYTDILPYDFSRVKLEVIDNDPNTDYINASFIKGFSGDEYYVACQGPKEETTYDFWRMIDQYDVKIIVMLTQLVEKNKEKCHQYFPTIKETFTYENMSIRCTSELDYRTYTQRTLILQKKCEKRTIIHLHFKDWPDHDVPEDFDPMINFCQLMRRHMETYRGLVVIHCSAGIGRTGTLIAIDILLQHIKENRKLDVFGTVYRLRHHRINMVQRESQYAYIYNCIKQVLKNPYFSKTYKPPSVNPIFENNSQKKKEASNSSTNLVSSLETLKKSSFSTSVESAEPIYEATSELTSRTCYPFNGLRCAKSTSAIDTRPSEKLIGRYNTHDHPISDISNQVSNIKDSEISFDVTESEGSTTSLYENMQPLLRSKSAHAFGHEEDSYATQDLLEHDTSF